jgi:ribosome maturation factor RimP
MLDNLLQKLLEPVVMAMGYQLWGVERLKQGRDLLLRVYIDHQNGISVDDCGLVSQQISAFLDVENPIKGEYVLEVSSPGLERPLFFIEQFQEFEGEKVFIRLLRPQQGQRHFKGLLTRVQDDVIILQDGSDTQHHLRYADIDKAHLLATIPSPHRKSA